ncbi:uncharacterized protein LOC121596248 isoform X1 [Anopheles merus]|uniref:uncharacterized protein LOC121596248 isoform X1 n=1 Tax=Anopheles merus TaxID=30066 RepID=UPI001BE446D7|nr:uncharacterized protein LOC121596248 isoform X1 [Anopheles merus]
MLCYICSQNLYLPLNHTHHSDTYFIDIFARNLRCALVGLALFIVLLNALLTRKHAPVRHLLFVYELLSGARAYPHPSEHVPNRTLQLLLGIVLQIFSCALATFLVAQLSIPRSELPVHNLKDLANHPEYKVCIPTLSRLARHIPALVRGSTHQKRFDHDCQRLVQGNDPEKLADYICDRNNFVVVLASDATMNQIFHDAKLLERMCDIIPIERKVVVNWLALPYSGAFKHVEQLKQFFIMARTTGLLHKPYRHLVGFWNRQPKQKKNRWADIELASLKMLFLGYGTVGCCSLAMLLVELLVAKGWEIYKIVKVYKTETSRK